MTFQLISMEKTDLASEQTELRTWPWGSQSDPGQCGFPHRKSDATVSRAVHSFTASLHPHGPRQTMRARSLHSTLLRPPIATALGTFNVGLVESAEKNPQRGCFQNNSTHLDWWRLAWRRKTEWLLCAAVPVKKTHAGTTDLSVNLASKTKWHLDGQAQLFNSPGSLDTL